MAEDQALDLCLKPSWVRDSWHPPPPSQGAAPPPPPTPSATPTPSAVPTSQHINPLFPSHHHEHPPALAAALARAVPQSGLCPSLQLWHCLGPGPVP